MAGSDAPVPPPPPPGVPLLTPEQLAALPHDNGGPMLNIAMWMMIGVSASFLSLRVYCKFLRHNGLWWDDYILIAAWVCITIESALLSYAVTLGYGLHSWDFPLENLQKVVLDVTVAGTFSICAAIWSKTSFALTLLRLTEGWMKIIVWYIIISMNVAMGLSALFNWVWCTPVNKSWNPLADGTCWPISVLVNYDIFSAAYSATMDITLALLPWALIWKLQMKKKEKVGVAIAMSMGVFAGVTALVKTSKIHNLASSDMYDGIDLFIWGNAESNVTIIAASIPILRVLVREVKTSARGYYATGDHVSSSKLRTQHSAHVTTGRPPKQRHDDQSDKSILGPEVPRSGSIMRTHEIAVEYHTRRDADSDEFELQHV